MLLTIFYSPVREYYSDLGAVSVTFVYVSLGPSSLYQIAYPDYISRIGITDAD